MKWGWSSCSNVFRLVQSDMSELPATESMSKGLDGASTENTTFQSRSPTFQATCNNDRSDESNEDEDIESSLECENTNDVEGKEKKSFREKMKQMLSNRRNKKLGKNIPLDQQILVLNKE